jgi:hypothetical protein
VFPPLPVSTAWATLLYVVSPEIALAATSIGRNGLESFDLELVSDFRFGSTTAENTVTNSRLLYPQQQTLTL